MGRSILLSLSLVLMLFSIQFGHAQDDVDRIATVVNEALRPILNEIKEDITLVKHNIANLSETVSHLVQDFEDHKDKTASEIANLQSLCTDGSPMILENMKKLQSKVNSVHTRMKTYFLSLDEKVNYMMNSELSPIGARLTTLNDLVTADLGDVKSELSGVSSMTQEICDKIEEHNAEITAELTEMRENLTHHFTDGGRDASVSTGGWRRAVFLNMSDPTTNCPPGWQLTGYSRRTCGRVNTSALSCDSVFFPVSGPYNQVWGRIRAYQWGRQGSFLGYGYYKQNTIDSAYFSGVAVMHGSPREHIWTFVAGREENRTTSSRNCPCDTAVRIVSQIPEFVGDDYFCESGYVWPGYYRSQDSLRLYADDPLWDGKGCDVTSTCCSQHNPPYFMKTLRKTTTDDIELRMCYYDPQPYSNIAIELVELYVRHDYVQTKLEEIDNRLEESLTRQTGQINSLHVHTCGGTGGWRKAVYFDMTDYSTNCPDGWQITGHSKRTCSRSRSIEWTCDSTFIPVYGGPYNQVCGSIKAYQFGLPKAFYGHRYGLSAIDNAYFDGVAVMHGFPRNHIWTFAAGAWENAWRREPQSWYNCPCDGTYNQPPSFVGDDYFCESAYVHPGYRSRKLEQRLHYNDTLWDGKDCLSTSTCCSLHRPPYFTKNLSHTASDDLELRICDFEQENNIAVEMVEIYVKLDPEMQQQSEITGTPPRPTFYDSSVHVHTCGGTVGWRRAVYLDMTDPSTDCPAGWKLTGYSKRTCHSLSDGQASCDSAFFPVGGGPYRQVCGKIRAYQWHSPAAFTLSYNSNTPDDPYFDGVAVLHGQRPRQHIWTFAAGTPENATNLGSSAICPCDRGGGRYYHPPLFVGEDYFCESGYINPGYYDRDAINQLHYNDTLWDGEDCHHTSTCCSLHNPPYFTKTLSDITDDDLEVRSCTYGSPVAIELVELYVKP